MFSNERDITEAFPSSSRRATNGDWKLFDIHDDDGSEALSACPGPQDEYEIREVPKKFGESKGRKQNRELEEKDEVSGGHIEEQENVKEPDEHQESQEDKTLDQSELPGREQVEEREQAPVGNGESQADKTLDQNGVPRREQVEEQGQKTVEREESREEKTLDRSEVSGREQVEERERESVEREESHEDKTLDQDGVPEREQVEEQGQGQGQGHGQRQRQEPVEREESQEDKALDQDEVPQRERGQEKVPKQHGESQEDESPDRNEDDRDKQPKLRIVPELARPTSVDIAPKPDTHKKWERLSGKMLKESEYIMKVEDPRDSDILIP